MYNSLSRYGRGDINKNKSSENIVLQYTIWLKFKKKRIKVYCFEYILKFSKSNTRV